MLSFMKVKCMVLAFFVNVDLIECEILVVDNLIKKRRADVVGSPDSLASLILEQPY